jgi:protein-L-isoaspartate(D-aspartate) O-methyltransferase
MKLKAEFTNGNTMKNQHELVNNLIVSGALKTKRIIEAFYKIDRADFVSPSDRSNAYVNHALGIGYGQTISQPEVVAFMLELLDPNPGEKFLDIGSGSGWTTALLAEIVGLKGCVLGLELVSELVEFGQKNLEKYNFENVQIIQAKEGVLGLPGEIFDKVLVSASASSLPQELIEQFTKKLVIPIKDSIWLISKNLNGNIKQQKYYGFNFVPLIKKGYI